MEKSEAFNVNTVSDRDIIARDSRPLECDLTADESRLRGCQLARELSNLELHKATEAEKRERANAASKLIDGKIGTLKKAIETNREDRLIDCVTYFEGSKIKTARIDTGEVIEQRLATIHELQVHMPGMANTGGVAAEAGRRTRASSADDGAPDSDVSDDDRAYAPPAGLPLEDLTPATEAPAHVMLELGDGEDSSEAADDEEPGDDVLSTAAKVRRRNGKGKGAKKSKGKR